jgi:hypothetical protein
MNFVAKIKINTNLQNENVSIEKIHTSFSLFATVVAKLNQRWRH